MCREKFGRKVDRGFRMGPSGAPQPTTPPAGTNQSQRSFSHAKRKKTQKALRLSPYFCEEGARPVVVSPYFSRNPKLENDNVHVLPRGYLKSTTRGQHADIQTPNSSEGERKREREAVVVSPYFQKKNTEEGEASTSTRESDINHNFKPTTTVQHVDIQTPNSSERERKGEREAVAVSPYFQKKNEEGEASTFARESDINRGDVQTPNSSERERRRKRKTKREAVVVSPYFQKKNKEEGDASISARESDINHAEIQTPNSSDRERKRKRKGSRESDINHNFNKFLEAYRRKRRYNMWIPPKSVHGLLQEKYYEDPWKVLIICMLLNRTRGFQAANVIANLFELCPNANAATKAETEKIEDIITTLGLQKKRSMMIQQFSQDYLSDEWTHVTQLYGIGKYAADAYAIFCTGRWKDVNPDDHKLVLYWEDLWIYEKIRRSIR